MLRDVWEASLKNNQMIRLNLLFYFFIVSVFLNFFIMKWGHKLSPTSKKQIQNIHLEKFQDLVVW